MPTRRQLANAIRVLSMDAVQRANSGHPGAPMGMADIAEVLWNDFLKHNPAHPTWPDRDRFVLSNGHGSMLLYALLHLSGYDLSIDDLKQFRALHSKTPGHPEYGITPGIEVTTGPLGQGLANAVGMALAERALATTFNRDDFTIVDHHTYFSVGDGCLMEGISHEACSLAGTLKLGKLIGFYDSNRVSIDGDVGGWFTDNTAVRFIAYGWHVVDDVDGHDPDQIAQAIQAARNENNRPSLIICRTIIGFGSPGKQGSAASHGAPLGADEITRSREALAWHHEAFHIPDDYYAAWDARERGGLAEATWHETFTAYQRCYPDLAAEFKRRSAATLPDNWQAITDDYLRHVADAKDGIASRQASANTLEAYAPVLPELIGGSADLTDSNHTRWSGSRVLDSNITDGNYLHYGVREFAMAAINNGLSLHGGFIPYGGTFLIFSEYARNALRMAALMKLRNIFVLTHDSIGLGEDGPTHQAVEQAATLRLIPNMTVWRPCDAVETAVAWRLAIENSDGPSCLLLSRQTLPHIVRSDAQIADIRRGGYVLIDGTETPEVIVIATGSEVHLAQAAAAKINGSGRRVRVVSMPSTDIFDGEPQHYRDAVIPPSCRKRIAVEAGVTDYWRKYVGLDGVVIGIDQFGESAPAADVFTHLDVTEDALVTSINALIG